MKAFNIVLLGYISRRGFPLWHFNAMKNFSEPPTSYVPLALHELVVGVGAGFTTPDLGWDTAGFNDSFEQAKRGIEKVALDRQKRIAAKRQHVARIHEYQKKIMNHIQYGKKPRKYS